MTSVSEADIPIASLPHWTCRYGKRSITKFTCVAAAIDSADGPELQLQMDFRDKACIDLDEARSDCHGTLPQHTLYTLPSCIVTKKRPSM